MSFKPGKFYAIQATDDAGEAVFVEGSATTHAEKLKMIARKAKGFGNSSYYDDEDDYSPGRPIKISPNPFALKTWPMTTKVEDIIDVMRGIRKTCGAHVNPLSLKIVVVETSVTAFTPESPSDVETELRRFVLEKLSAEEQKLLKVEHWSVYNKLADRSMLKDDEEE